MVQKLFKDAGSMLIIKKEENMKNLHYLKKFVVMALAAMMTLSTFAMPTFAAQKDSQVTISGVEADATVTVYQVVKYENGEWKLVDSDKPVTLTNGSPAANPTAAEVTAIASNPGTLPYKVLDPVGSDYKSKAGELDPGLYVAVVTGTSSGTVYNPMVVSIDFSENNNTNSISADSKFTNNAYAKKSTPDLEKTTLDNQNRYDTADNPFTASYDAQNNPQNDRNVGTDMAGAVIPYKVVTTIPSYSATYEKPQFIFTDALQKGFAGYTEKPVVMEEVGNAYKTLVEGTDYWFVKSTSTEQTLASGEKVNVRDKEANDYTNVDKKTFSIAFNVETGKLARKICITYKAKLVDATDADYTSGLDPNTNEAKIEWTKDSADEDAFVESEDCTHHYTFNIDGNIGGGEVGKEIIKVGTDENGKLVVSEKELEKKWEPLNGAIFGIYKAQNTDQTPDKWTAGQKVYEVTTEDGGQMKFRGLDAGKYVIVEIQAPTGYAKNETPVPVEIIPTFETASHHGKDCQILKSYTIKINNEYTNTYTVDKGVVTKTSNSDSITQNENRTDAVQDIPGFTAGFVNSNIGTLPSTGGMGTVLFTVGGIAIMALALFLLFGGKKKQQQK